MNLLRCWLIDLFHRTSIRVCLLLETCLLMFILIGVTKSTTQIETINLFGYHFPSIAIGDLKAVEVLLLMIFHQSKLWILFIGLIGVSGFLGSNLQSPQIEMLLVRPIPRRKLLLSQYVATAIVFSVCILYLAIGLWLMIGLKVNVWHAGLVVGSVLLCIAYSVSLPFLVWLIVWSRNTFFALLIFYAFCFVSTGLEFRSEIFYSLWNNPWYHRLIDIFYYGLPQLDGMLADATDVLRHPDFWQALHALPGQHFLFSLAIGICYLILAITVFAKNDY
jgi:ABC-type transport system involved in multi-copper enzyme maturation permease subunit